MMRCQLLVLALAVSPTSVAQSVAEDNSLEASARRAFGGIEVKYCMS